MHASLDLDLCTVLECSAWQLASVFPGRRQPSLPFRATFAGESLFVKVPFGRRRMRIIIDNRFDRPLGVSIKGSCWNYAVDGAVTAAVAGEAGAHEWPAGASNHIQR